jgi:hypothetical protein
VAESIQGFSGPGNHVIYRLLLIWLLSVLASERPRQVVHSAKNALNAVALAYIPLPLEDPVRPRVKRKKAQQTRNANQPDVVNHKFLTLVTLTL